MVRIFGENLANLSRRPREERAVNKMAHREISAVKQKLRKVDCI